MLYELPYFRSNQYQRQYQHGSTKNNMRLRDRVGIRVKVHVCASIRIGLHVNSITRSGVRVRLSTHAWVRTHGGIRMRVIPSTRIRMKRIRISIPPPFVLLLASVFGVCSRTCTPPTLTPPRKPLP